jgi:hypothetical protein
MLMIKVLVLYNVEEYRNNISLVAVDNAEDYTSCSLQY